MVEGARLESVFRGNSNVGSNPTLSAILFSIAYGRTPNPAGNGGYQFLNSTYAFVTYLICASRVHVRFGEEIMQQP